MYNASLSHVTFQIDLYSHLNVVLFLMIVLTSLFHLFYNREMSLTTYHSDFLRHRIFPAHNKADSPGSLREDTRCYPSVAPEPFPQVSRYSPSESAITVHEKLREYFLLLSHNTSGSCEMRILKPDSLTYKKPHRFAILLATLGWK